MQQPTEDTPTLDATAQAAVGEGEGAAQAPAAEGPGQARTFTQEQVDRIIAERLKRARQQVPADYDELRDKAARLDDAQAKADEAERELAECKAALERADADARRTRTALDVSRQTGVPVDLIRGESADEMRASADAIAEFAASRRAGYPTDKGGASGGGKAVTVASIEAIKDPVARVRARARHQNLYNS